MGGRVEGVLAALGAGLHARAIREVARDRLGSPRANLRGGGVRARERSHAPTVADEPADQPAADEARAARHKRSAHQGVSLPVRRRDQ
jgi:hypothetical protein